MNNRMVSMLMVSVLPNAKEIRLLTCVTDPSQVPLKDRERKVGGKGGVENM